MRRAQGLTGIDAARLPWLRQSNMGLGSSSPFLCEQPFDNSGIREFGPAGARTNVKIVMNFKC